MFITLEGIEGSGKSTQLDNIHSYLKKRGQEVVVTREPGGTLIGKSLRAILLNPANRLIDPLTELLLYEADRAEHVRKIILPALAEGCTVLCDRFYDATVVYQGYARGQDRELIRQIHRIVLGTLTPDLTVLLDVSPEIGLARAWAQIETGGRAGEESRFEEEALAFHHKIRAGYLDIARLEPDRFCVVDASKDPLTVQHAIRACLHRVLGDDRDD
jgi:dTMP kinase